MRFLELVEASRDVAATRSRKAKSARLATLLRALPVDERELGVRYLVGQLPQGRIGIGYAMVRDLEPGPPAAAPSLTLPDLDRAFQTIAEAKGAGSTGRKRETLGGLFHRATDPERRFLTSLVLGEIRQGALLGVMIEAVAEATGAPSAAVRRAAMLAGDLAAVALAALADGEAGLAEFDLTVFRPVLPMLASPAEDVEAALGRLGEAAFELKMDGARVQVHKAAGDIRVFTRRLHDATNRVPELVEAVRALPARELILDGETIALRPDGKPHPFQTTMRRFGRRKNVEAERGKLPLSTFFFDVLRVDGETTLDAPLKHRLEVLDGLLPEDAKVPRILTENPEEASTFLDGALGQGHEGLMAKSLDAAYEAGSRGFSWLKLKVAHTLDLVVLAVEQGSGRRRGWLSNLHLGARDPKTGGFVMLGKTFKGMTDEMLAWQTEHLGQLAVGQQGHVVHVRPELVVEIAFSDVQASPTYPGGMALRFARVKRYRTDKAASDADTIEMVRAIHERAAG